MSSVFKLSLLLSHYRPSQWLLWESIKSGPNSLQRPVRCDQISFRHLWEKNFFHFFTIAFLAQTLKVQYCKGVIIFHKESYLCQHAGRIYNRLFSEPVDLKKVFWINVLAAAHITLKWIEFFLTILISARTHQNQMFSATHCSLWSLAFSLLSIWVQQTRCPNKISLSFGSPFQKIK